MLQQASPIASTANARLMLVDDDPICLAILEQVVRTAGYDSISVASAREALEILRTDSDSVSALLLDRMMPDMDGLMMLREIKADPRLQPIPVIMQTAAADPGEVIEGLEAGAYYYVTKPYDSAMLVPVLRAAAGERQERRRLHAELGRMEKILAHLHRGIFFVRTLEEARTMAIAVAGAFPDSGRVVAGLTELLVNAVEHGNAGISYEDKTRLLAEGSWEAEVARRLAEPENAGKKVELVFQRLPGSVEVSIADDGQGFNWRSYLEFAPSRACDSHGRGIALARKLSFDYLEYRGCGNEVVVRTHLN